MQWRVIITDTESMTGVAPVCDNEQGQHDAEGDGPGSVYDCCPHPHIELWDEDAAARTAVRFSELEAEACS